MAAFDGIKHYDGKRWTVAKLPDQDTHLHLADVEANSPKDIWAVVHREDPDFRRRPAAFSGAGDGSGSSDSYVGFTRAN